MSASVLPDCSCVFSSVVESFSTFASASVANGAPPRGPWSPPLPGPPAGRTPFTMSSRRVLNSAIFASTSACVCLPEATSACSFSVKSFSNCAFTSAMSTFWAFAMSASVLPDCSCVFSSVVESFSTFASASVAKRGACAPSAGAAAGASAAVAFTSPAAVVLPAADPVLAPSSAVAALPSAVDALSVSTDCTTAGASFGARRALAKPVRPSTAAPEVTTRPAATATFVKRDFVFMVGFLLCGSVHRVFPAGDHCALPR